MAGKYNDLTNVDDFVEHKMHRLIEQYAKLNREDGNLLISFDNGWPIVKYPEP